MSLKERYLSLKEELKSYPQVTLIAVSKKQPLHKIIELYRLGHRDFGENYVQELIEKNDLMTKAGMPDIQWHLIGPLQKNKINSLLKAPFHHPFILHSVDSLEFAKLLSQKITTPNSGVKIKVLPFFAQINIDHEATKSGFSEEQFESYAAQLKELQGLSLQGLMCIPRPAPDSTRAFVRMRHLSQMTSPSLKLSMGMSEDYKEALKHGATHIRIGTYLFGERQ
jgi:pyridoxal phosphate enzyme (YggS family)